MFLIVKHKLCTDKLIWKTIFIFFIMSFYFSKKNNIFRISDLWKWSTLCVSSFALSPYTHTQESP